MMKTLFNRNTLRSLPKQDLLALKCSLEYAKRNLRFEFPPPYAEKQRTLLELLLAEIKLITKEK
jgi:hypothetical protein